MIFLFVISLVSVGIILKRFDLAEKRPDLHKILGFVRIAIFVLGGGMFLVHDNQEYLVRIGWLIILNFIVYILILYRDHRLANSMLMAIVPFVVVDTAIEFLAFAAPAFTSENKSIFDLLRGASYIWIFAIGISISNQQKALRKEEEKRRKIEEENNSLEQLVKERTKEIEAQKNSLQEALNNLKITQNQLIQSEKLASLGELTAGIAHEIQNPLNFVNNFSEINSELLTELAEELEQGRSEEVALILKDIKENEEKIAYHGKRADAIVKSMLQHSRRTEGSFEATDLNALADEYLRLSYHGLRAKDKSFNANFEVKADPDLPKLEVKPQEIGRVILNLINNAFYAVNQRKSMEGEGYKPEVTVTTRNKPKWVEIEVKDNGIGIPDEVKSKIFQPFFTSKPAGQGTGLGLSLSYDIITAGHGGKLSMQSEEGQGTSFIIQLPKKK